MKKIKIVLVAALFSIICIPTQAKVVSERDPASLVSTPAAESAETRALLNRLDEIRAMTKSDLSPAEKKQIRQEVRQIKESLKAPASGGVYLSVGAIILIALLLILLL